MRPSNDTAMTVYGPEVEQSSITSPLDRYLAERTGLEMAERFWVVHDTASITRFYDLTSATHGTHWPLVVDLFNGRPACVTIWRGPESLSKLRVTKGATQPANADAETVRGRFWCDNPVCNLVHVSDDALVMTEELSLLRSLEMAKSNGRNVAGNPASALTIRHSALWEFARVLADLSGHNNPETALPASGNAREAAGIAIDQIVSMARSGPVWIGALAAEYLAGCSTSIDTVKRQYRQLTDWQELVLKCGLHSNPVWMKLLRAEAAIERAREVCI